MKTANTEEKAKTPFKPTDELDRLYSKAMVDGDLRVGDMEKLARAGYVTKGKDSEGYDTTKEAAKHGREKLPEQTEVIMKRARAIEKKEREQREKERVEKGRTRDAELAAHFESQGLLSVDKGVFRLTAEGRKRAFSWLRMELNRAISRPAEYTMNNKISANVGDYDGVPVDKPWLCHDNETALSANPYDDGFKRVRKSIVASLNDEERQLFGLPLKRPNRTAMATKERILTALRKYAGGGEEL